jgi:hypothetical protein
VAYRHHHHRQICPSRRGGAGKRILHVLAVGVVVAVGVSMFRDRSDRSVATPPRPKPMAGMSPRNLQAHAADNGIAAGAAAARRALAAPAVSPENETGPGRTVLVKTTVTRNPDPARMAAPDSPRPDSASGKPEPAIALRVRSDGAHPSRERAINDALLLAAAQIEKHLAALDPPITANVTADQVRADYLRPDSIRDIPPTPADKAAWEEQGIDTDRLWVEIDVEVSEDQVRQLRAEQRLGSAGMVGAVAFVLVLAVYGFLRLDAWTRGYLTGSLAVGIAAVAGIAVAVVFLVR